MCCVLPLSRPSPPPRALQRSQGTVSQEKTSSRQGYRTDRPALKLSSLASVKVNYWKMAVGQGVKVPSPDIVRPLCPRRLRNLKLLQGVCGGVGPSFRPAGKGESPRCGPRAA